MGSLGHESDDETGLIYMRARYYDPLVGRFASEDPDKRGVNWYVYCHNDPENYFDISGKDESCASIGAAMCGLVTLFSTFAQNLGVKIAEGAEPFMVEGQVLVGRAQYVVQNLMTDLNISGGTEDFDMWAIKTMGGAGGTFIKAWVTTNLQQSMALHYLIDDEGGEIFTSHPTPYVGNLQEY